MAEKTEMSPNLTYPEHNNNNNSTAGEDVASNEKALVTNSSLEKWLTVVAGFCVFVNSW
jgi:hypothetical protein